VDLLPKQWEVFSPAEGADYDIALYQGGFGSGKTFLGALLGLSTMASNPGCTWLVVADTYSRLNLTTWETYRELLTDAGIKHKANKTDHVITVPGWGNSKAIFKGLDDPLSLRSVNGIGAHIEEASLLSESAYLELLGRLRQAGNDDAIRVILTTNPQMTRGWLYAHFVERAGVTVEKVRGKNVRFNRRRVIAATLDNPHVSDAFIAAMQASYDDELYRILVLGEDRDYTKGLVCYNFTEANIDDTDYRPELKLYLSCDFNVDPMSWVVAHRFNGEYHFIDELVIENTTTVQAAEEFYRRYGEHGAGVILTGDASGDARRVEQATLLDTNYNVIRNRLSSLGMRSVHVDLPSHNPFVDLRTQAWNALTANTEGVRRIKINPRCKWLIDNCRNLRYVPGASEIWEPTRKQIEADSKLKFVKHVWDAASYLTYRYDPIKLNEHVRPNHRVVAAPYVPTR
jgi:PBSX family phage terminase large subunit